MLDYKQAKQVRQSCGSEKLKPLVTHHTTLYLPTFNAKPYQLDNFPLHRKLHIPLIYTSNTNIQLYVCTYM